MIRNIDTIADNIRKNIYVKIGLYVATGIVGIWVLGKATFLLADATRNFKNFLNEFKQT